MDLSNFIRTLTIYGPPFLLAITFHEFAHGYVAHRYGDPTAKMQGRLTLNPLKHLDPIGTIAFFIMKIGWAKPVQVNPMYFKNPAKDMMRVSLAGPGANLLLAIASAFVAKILVFVAPIFPAALVNFALRPLYLMIEASIWINIMLAIFNLVPVPPLDGSKILMGMLPRDLAAAYARIEPFGFIILLLLFYTGILGNIIGPLIAITHAIIAG